MGLSNLLGIDNGTGRIYEFAPLFIVGTMLADMEVFSKKYRLLDKFRYMNPRMTIVKNTVLVSIFLIYGSYNGKPNCNDEVDCSFLKLISFGFLIPSKPCNYLGCIALFLLALTSEAV